MESELQRIPIQLSRDCLVASIQTDLSEAMMERFRDALLGRLQETGAQAVVIDVSGVAIMDCSDFAALRDLLRMSAVMGAVAVLTGIQPGVACALAELGADTTDLNTARTLDEGLNWAVSHRRSTIRQGTTTHGR